MEIIPKLGWIVLKIAFKSGGGLFGLLKILDCIRACGGSILYENFFFAQRLGNE